MIPQNKREQVFIEHLIGLKDDRAARAALRRSLASPEGFAFGADRYIVGWLPHGPSVWHERCHYLVAGLFATHPNNLNPDEGEPSNFGVSFAKLGRDNGEIKESIERRFTAILNAEAEDLPVHLRHAVALLRAADQPVNWLQLLLDIQRWNSPNRWVQRDWSRGFWAASAYEQNVSNQENQDVS